MTYELVIGDCLDALRRMPDESVHCCVTSPPSYGEFSYGLRDHIGRASTPGEYVVRLVEIFREVRRVLRADGTLWLKLQDNYASVEVVKTIAAHSEGRRSWVKPKDLIGIPWRVAFALQADGWYLRQDVIWNKGPTQADKAGDRCLKGHEHIFMLTRSPNYRFDAKAVSEPRPSAAKRPKGAPVRPQDKRKRGSVWVAPPLAFQRAHIATFPPALIEPCIRASCPRGGTVLDPFGGTGTVAGVALKHRRKAIIIELNENNLGMIRERVDSVVGRPVPPPETPWERILRYAMWRREPL